MTFRLHLRNFQSIGEATLDIAPLTFLYGPNSAGKSSVADALGLLRGAVGWRDQLTRRDWSERFFRHGCSESVIGIGGDVSAAGGYWETDYESLSFSSWFDGSYSFDSLKKSVLYADMTITTARRERFIPGRGVLSLGEFTVSTVYLNGEKAIEYDEKESSLTIFMANSLLKSLVGALCSDPGVLDDDAYQYVQHGDGRIVVSNILDDVSRKDRGWALSEFYFDDGRSSGHLAKVLSAIYRRLVSVSVCSSGLFAESLFGNEFSEEHAHIGPIRVVPGGEIVTDSEKPIWHNGSHAWELISELVIARHRMGICERLAHGIEGGAVNQEFELTEAELQQISRLLFFSSSTRSNTSTSVATRKFPDEFDFMRQIFGESVAFLAVTGPAMRPSGALRASPHAM